MKRTLAITAVTALLALSLAACGAERTDGGMTGPNGGETDGGIGSVAGAVVRGRDSTRFAGAGRGYAEDDDAVYGIGGPNSSVYAARNAGGMSREERDAQAAGDRYARMLENGRVHDTDGFLLDGENSSYGTF